MSFSIETFQQIRTVHIIVVFSVNTHNFGCELRGEVGRGGAGVEPLLLC